MLRKFTVFLLFLGLIAMITGVILSEGNFEELITTVKTQYMLDYEHKTVEGEGAISEVEVDLVNNNVYFYYSEDETYFIDYQTAEEDAINVSVADGKIVMKHGKHIWYKAFRFRYKTEEQRRVNIYLPLSFAGDITVDVTAGSVEFKNFVANDVLIDTTSGNVNLENATIDELDINLTSGEAFLTAINANTVKVDHTSGKATLSEVKTTSLSMNATSGGINIAGTEASTVTISLTTGSINIESIKTDTLSTNLTSGNTNINVVGNADDYKAILEATTGKIVYNGVRYKNTTINAEGTKLINAYCTSGNITIQFIEE